jgi:hypothetical protein
MTQADTGRRRGEPQAVKTISDEELEAIELYDEEPDANRKVLRQRSAGDLGSTVETEVKRMARLVMYSPEGVRKAVRPSAVKEMRFAGYTIKCPKCGGRDCGGILGDCPANPDRAYTICPVMGCGRRIVDRTLAEDAPERENPRGEYIEFKSDTSAQQRLNVLLERHMAFAHPAEAPLYGFTRSRDAVLGTR